MIKHTHDTILGSNYYFEPIPENQRNKRRKTKKTKKNFNKPNGNHLANIK